MDRLDAGKRLMRAAVLAVIKAIEADRLAEKAAGLCARLLSGLVTTGSYGEE
ncbi:hypothetical protein ACFIOY_19060 [Bradyrhizobium sp. TZ2]